MLLTLRHASREFGQLLTHLTGWFAASQTAHLRRVCEAGMAQPRKHLYGSIPSPTWVNAPNIDSPPVPCGLRGRRRHWR